MVLDSALLEVVRDRLRPNDIVLRVGSTVTGLSHSNSDYDLYIIHVGSDDGWSELVETLTVPALGRAVEIEEFSFAAIQKVAGRVKQLSLAQAAEIREMPQEVLVRYSAIVTGRPICDLGAAWSSLLRQLEPDVYRAFAERWHEAWAEALCETAAFARFIGDYEAADAAIRAMVVHAADAAIVGRGELYFSPKFRFDKAGRAGFPPDWLQGLWEFHAPLSRLTSRAIDRRLAAARQWAKDVLKERECSVQVPALVPDAQLLRVGEDLIVILGSRAWPVDPIVQRLWDVLDRVQDWPRLIKRCEGLSEPDVKRWIRFLAKRGLLMIPSKLGRWATWV